MDHRCPVRRSPAKRLLAWLAVLAVLAVPAAARAQALRVELNKLEDTGHGCRAYIVTENATEAGFSVFKIDLVLFDRNGVISKRVAVNIAPLRPRKMTVKLFDIEGVDCAGTERILINDVIECRQGKATRANCVDLVVPASRTGATLIK